MDKKKDILCQIQKQRYMNFKYNGRVLSVAFSNDDSILASGDFTGKTTIYDVTT